MQSTGQWYQRVPKEQQRNLLFRKFVLGQAKGSPALQRALIEACRQDILFFISLFVWQYNGKKRGDEVGPFIPWDFQEEAALEILRCVRDGEDLIIEKSRDMGASWLCLLVVIWTWLFHPWKTVLVMSKSEIAVERKDPEALFWKIDFILRHVPTWLLQGYMPKVHRKKMVFRHPNGSTIYGTASTGRAGVGGKCTFMFIDEFSQIAEAFEVLHRTSDTTDCRIFNGTHMGTGTAFYELTDPQSAAGAYINKLVMHWTQHPEKCKGLYQFHPDKNFVEVIDKKHEYLETFQFAKTPAPVGGPYPGIRSPWYDDQCQRKGNARAVAMDLDIDPSGSVKQVFDPLLIRQLIGAYASEPYWEGDIAYDFDLGRVLYLTKRKGGALRLWCHLIKDRPPEGRYVLFADVAQGTGATPSCVTGLNADTGEKVLEYTDPFIDAKHLGSLCVALAWFFRGIDERGAYLGWEVPGPGLTMGGQVKDLHYANVYRRDPQKFGNGEQIAGWVATPSNKLRVLNEYHHALQARKFLNHSKLALEECLKFRYTPSGAPEHAGEASKGDPSGARYNHGDHVMADAGACWLAKLLRVVRPDKPAAAVPVMSMLWRRQLRAGREKVGEDW